MDVFKASSAASRSSPSHDEIENVSVLMALAPASMYSPSTALAGRFSLYVVIAPSNKSGPRVKKRFTSFMIEHLSGDSHAILRVL